MISKKDIHVYGWNHRILLRANEFICLSPHPGLKEYISSYNITFPDKGLMPAGFTVMPCGCATLTIECDSKKLLIYLEGPTTKPYIVGSQTSHLEMLVTIEFKPAGLYALTGISQNELADEMILFDAVNPRLTKLISDMVEKAESVDELITILDMLLLENMYTSYHPQLILAVQNIVGNGGDIGIKELSEDIYYSERQLNRIFRQHVGTSAKSFSRLIRVNKAFQLFKKPDNSLTVISDKMGYHDLSHFIRDFRSVCGITPQEYRNNMSDFYTNTKKF